MGKIRDLAGQKFGKLTVIAFAGLNNHNKAQWSCRCDCGNSSTVVGRHLLSGHTTSCGCVQVASRMTHGQTMGRKKSGAYVSWQMMHIRCYRPGATGYANYGGRGIAVCERWNIFENFFADMGERPCRATLDRKDNDGHYEPGNCRWATRREQGANRRTTELSWVAACLIRYMQRRGASHRRLGHAFGVTHTTIQAVLRRYTWSVPMLLTPGRAGDSPALVELSGRRATVAS